MPVALSNDRFSSGRPLWLGTLGVFLLALAFFAFLYLPSPLIYDADSYYHLAIARAYAHQGIFDRLESVRFGLLAEQFGDKEFLFHAALVPFAGRLDAAVGGRLALALLGASILALVGNLAMRSAGRWGLLVPFWMVLGSLEFTWRLVRLRPELVSLAILLVALWATVRKKYLLLGFLALIYALSYTAIHAFLGIFALVFLVHLVAYRRFDWRILTLPALGAVVGLSVHPQFPGNLVVWWFQSVEYFRLKGALDVGTEIQPLRADIALLVNFGWLLGMLLLWRSRQKTSEPGSSRAVLTFGTAAAVFGVLYVMMSRFALYFVPLATLTLLFEIRRQGSVISDRVRLPFKGSLRTTWAWALCLLSCLPVSGYELARYRQRNSPGPDHARLTDRELFAAALPVGAKVANPWRSTPIYMYWAPHGRYLNVLDPVFLAASDWKVHQVQAAIFAGIEPDVPLKAAVELDSDFVAFSAATGDRTLIQRLAADPRIEPSYRGSNLLFAIRPPHAPAFILDWRVVPADAALPLTEGMDDSDWMRYPLSTSLRARALEGYVDALRVVEPGRCLALTRSFEVTESSSKVLEFAPYGPSTIWVDGEQSALVREPRGAVLGRGEPVRLELEPGSHRLSVSTCPVPGSAAAGFYLVDRSEG